MILKMRSLSQCHLLVGLIVALLFSTVLGQSDNNCTVEQSARKGSGDQGAL